MIYGCTDRPDFAITNTNFFVFINFFTKCKLLHRVGASGSKYGVKRAAFFFAEACVKASTSDYEKKRERDPAEYGYTLTKYLYLH